VFEASGYGLTGNGETTHRRHVTETVGDLYDSFIVADQTDGTVCATVIPGDRRCAMERSWASRRSETSA
jgi:hypothetical protein